MVVVDGDVNGNVSVVVDDALHDDVEGNVSAGDMGVFGRVSVGCRFHRGLSGVCPTCAFGVYAHNYG